MLETLNQIAGKKLEGVQVLPDMLPSYLSGQLEK